MPTPVPPPTEPTLEPTPGPTGESTGPRDAATGGGRQTGATRAGAWSGRPDASMTLITEMMERPLDPSYAAEAERRRAAGRPPARVHPWRMALVAFLVGLLLVTAAQALRQPKDAIAGQKQALISQIRSAQQQADALAAQQTTLQGAIAASRRDTLDEADRGDLATRLQNAEVVAGTSAVTGPGLVVTLDNSATAAGSAADGDPRTDGGTDLGKIVSRDLQIVANGLWAAGAEAVAINGQRLTSTAAIRFAGDAILVDYRPLARPYVVTAIGAPKDLERGFTRTEGGQYVQGLADTYGVRYEREARESVTVPAGSSARVRHAHPLAPHAPTGTPRPATPSRPSPTSSETAP